MIPSLPSFAGPVEPNTGASSIAQPWPAIPAAETTKVLSPEVMALTGTTLQEAIDAAQKIEENAGKVAAAETAEADQKLTQAQADAALKIAEAQRILDNAEAQAAAKLAQAKVVSDAAIAASVRAAAEDPPLGDLAARRQPGASGEIARALSRVAGAARRPGRHVHLAPPASGNR